MICFPPCKINLGLHITGKQSDGYHTIETCFYPIPWTDILEIIPADTFAFNCSGYSLPGNPSDNLVVKAFRMLRKDFDLGEVAIHLHKIIPHGAGLGGGSSDAASTLMLLNSIFSLSLSKSAIKNYASRLGSDCAFFIENTAMLGTGRGDVLQKIEVNLKNKFLVVIKPEISISTAEAYAHVAPKTPSISLEKIVGKDISTWKNALVNDFEKSVIEKFPEIGMLKNTLYNHGAEYASMSGSGSAVFAIFNEPVNLARHFSGVGYWARQLTA